MGSLVRSCVLGTNALGILPCEQCKLATQWMIAKYKKWQPASLDFIHKFNVRTCNLAIIQSGSTRDHTLNSGSRWTIMGSDLSKSGARNPHVYLSLVGGPMNK